MEKQIRVAKVKLALSTSTSVHTSKRTCLKISSPPPLQGLLPLPSSSLVPVSVALQVGQLKVSTPRNCLWSLYEGPSFSAPLTPQPLCSSAFHQLCLGYRMFFLKPGSHHATPAAPWSETFPVLNLAPSRPLPSIHTWLTCLLRS